MEKRKRVVLLLTPLAVACSTVSTTPAPAPRPFVCPLTQESPPPFEVPYGGSGHFWHGSSSLAVLLPSDGRWHRLGFEKLTWYSDGFEGPISPGPALAVTGRNLGDGSTAGVSEARNQYWSPGRWGMEVYVRLPTEGCWEITGEYEGYTVTFVTWFDDEQVEVP